MPTFSISRQIAAPTALVWTRVAAVVNWPDWLPTVSRVERSNAKELAVGAKFKVVQPKLRPAVWTVTALNPGRNFIWVSSSPGLRLWANHTVEQAPDDGSVIKLELRFSGVLAPLVALLAGGITRRYLEAEAESLKQHAEADARSEA